MWNGCGSGEGRRRVVEPQSASAQDLVEDAVAMASISATAGLIGGSSRLWLIESLAAGRRYSSSAAREIRSGPFVPPRNACSSPRWTAR